MSEKFKQQLQAHFEGANVTEKDGYVCVHVEGELEAEDLLPAASMGLMKLKRSGSGITLYFKNMYAEMDKCFRDAMDMALEKVKPGTGLKIICTDTAVEMEAKLGKDGVPLLVGALSQEEKLFKIFLGASAKLIETYKVYFKNNEDENQD